MTDVYSGIDFIFNCMVSFFQLTISYWPLAMFLLGGLISLVITIYLNSRSQE